MQLLQADVDTSVIALWLGHENIETTQSELSCFASASTRVR